MLSSSEEALFNLGVSFNSETSKSLQSPEQILLYLVQRPDFHASRRYYSLLRLVIEEYQKFYRLEVIFHQIENLDALSSGYLGAIISEFFDNKSAWFIRTIKVLKKQSKRNAYQLSSEKRVELQGEEKFLAKFGIYTTPFQNQHRVKLQERSKFFKSNLWLLNRLNFGVNLRADIATLRTLGLEEKAYGVMKRLKSSKASTYKIWKELDEYDRIAN